ncbi:DNA gyrase subunit A [Sulfitobacter sp. R18_1]|uniref:DNA gyrase subunit A n=1 Tax=Sulfitobacter sp. R18_1 TaxID=2821104 RepID=UPI001ADB1822|nr:DNA gyrase subunit A [Sulfitobacter sp. R18_1]MBO9428469.1 DNA gyrase subunit A [Sulfitobacter sp. R18_1]
MLDNADQGLEKASTIFIEDEMHESYMNYSMSVILSRSIPDVRDGCKPVHRRILYAMDNGGYTKDKPYRKSARIVGDVMGKYHPHGDSAIYDTMVRMAQDFSMRTTLIDGQGNFGSMDGDGAAAMRYTEARMARAAHDMTKDIDRGTVGWRPTYDGHDQEPSVLPARIPNLIINGATGIAVGMATNMPAHNPGEAIRAVMHLLDNPDATLDDIMNIMPGPDFPTGGTIMGRAGIRNAYETGRGSITVQGVIDVEERKGGKSRIVISEFPYAVNKATFQQKVAELVNNKEIDGITDIRDESDRESNVRVVIDVKRDADPHLVINKLKKKTQLVNNFAVNASCLDARGRPRVMNMMEQLQAFVDHRLDVVRKRTIFDLDKARDALHKQIGLYAAVSLIDEVVRVIKSSPDAETAQNRLMEMPFPTKGDFARLLIDADPDISDEERELLGKDDHRFYLQADQADAILALNLRRLTGMERDKIEQKARDISQEIEGYTRILNEPETLKTVVRNELSDVLARYDEPRRTSIENSEMDVLSDEDLIERRDVVLTLTHGGYVKRTFLDAYREQHRGGKGKAGMETKEGDFVTKALTCSTHSPLIFFTSRGIAHSLKAFQLPEGQANARGRPLVNYMPLRHTEGETITSVMALPEGLEEIEKYSMVFVTDFGNVRRTDAQDMININKRGKIAMQLEDDNGRPIGRLVNVLLCKEDDTILINTKKGMAVQIRVGDLRVVKSRSSTGVRGVTLKDGDEVVGANFLPANDVTYQERQAYLAGGNVTLGDDENPIEVSLTERRMQEIASQECFLMTVSENGFGKRVSAYEFRTVNRGGKGVTCATINKTTGDLAACFPVEENDGLLLITAAGQTIRTPISETRVQGRATRGVRLFRMEDGHTIVSATRVVAAPDEEDAE